MGGPSRPSRAGAVAVAALRAVGLGLWQAARYLGPLSLEAASYAWRLGADGIHGIRVWLLRRQARKAPERSAHFAEIEGAGHLSNLEQPEAFNAALLGFLARQG